MPRSVRLACIGARASFVHRLRRIFLYNECILHNRLHCPRGDDAWYHSACILCCRHYILSSAHNGPPRCVGQRVRDKASCDCNLDEGTSAFFPDPAFGSGCQGASPNRRSCIAFSYCILPSRTRWLEIRLRLRLHPHPPQQLQALQGKLGECYSLSARIKLTLVPPEDGDQVEVPAA